MKFLKNCATLRIGWTLACRCPSCGLWGLAPPASTSGSPPTPGKKRHGSLEGRSPSPQPPSSPRPQSIPTLPPRRPWMGHRRRPGEMDGEPNRTLSQPPQELPRPWAKSSPSSKGMRAGSCNQGRGGTPHEDRTGPQSVRCLSREKWK